MDEGVVERDVAHECDDLVVLDADAVLADGLDVVPCFDGLLGDSFEREGVDRDGERHGALGLRNIEDDGHGTGTSSLAESADDEHDVVSGEGLADLILVDVRASLAEDLLAPGALSVKDILADVQLLVGGGLAECGLVRVDRYGVDRAHGLVERADNIAAGTAYADDHYARLDRDPVILYDHLVHLVDLM